MCRLSPSSALGLFVMLLLLPITAEGQEARILTNHLGYEADGTKQALVQGESDLTVQSFRVLDTETGASVYSGTPQEAGAVPEWKDWHFWTLSFSTVQEEGTYRLVARTENGSVRSFPFKIQENVLERHTLSDVVYYFKAQRSAGLYAKADRHLTFEGPRDDTVDAHGGWYDATGDYGKHLSHLSFSTYFNPQQTPLVVWGLFEAREQLMSRDNPNFQQYRRRMLWEALYGADFLVRMRDDEGSFYRSVSAPGAKKKPGDRVIAPAMGNFELTDESEATGEASEEDGADEASDVPSGGQLYDVSFRSGGGVAIAALARASTYDATGQFSNERYLQAAEAAFSVLQEHNARYTNDGRENIVDDYTALLAAVELYKATDDPRYKAAADRRAERLMNRQTSTESYTNYWRADDGDRPFFHASDAGFPVVSLLSYHEIADASTQTDVLATVKRSLQFELQVTQEVTNPFGYSRQLVQDTTGHRRTEFFFPHDTETAPWWQGENARLASMATAARMARPHFSDDDAFQEQLDRFARNQLHWILGRNPYDVSMLRGTGRNNPEYLFFNSYEYTNVPGGISNGITGGMRDGVGIAWNRGYAVTGKDDDWRWKEQWLPHVTWYLLAVSAHR